MENSSLKRMEIFIELSAQNHRCQSGFSDVGTSLHVALEQVLSPSTCHLFKMKALYSSVFFKVHCSCSRVAGFRLSEIFVDFKDSSALPSSEFPSQLLFDSSMIEYPLVLYAPRRKFNLSFTGPKSAHFCPPSIRCFTCPSSFLLCCLCE